MQKAISPVATWNTSSVCHISECRRKKQRKQEGSLCVKCGGSGYKGRVGTYELMTINSSIRESIKQNKSTHEIEQIAVQSGMLTLKRYGVELIREQLTTISELQKICNTEN